MKYPLIRNFTLYSMLAFILTGIILTYILSGHIEDNKLADLEEAARFTVKMVARSDMDIADLNSAISGTEKERIRSDVLSSMDSYGIESITLVNREKTVIMSGDPEFEDDIYLNRVLNAESPFAISDTFNIINSGIYQDSRPVFNIYEPVTERQRHLLIKTRNWKGEKV